MSASAISYSARSLCILNLQRDSSSLNVNLHIKNIQIKTYLANFSVEMWQQLSFPLSIMCTLGDFMSDGKTVLLVVFFNLHQLILAFLRSFHHLNLNNKIPISCYCFSLPISSFSNIYLANPSNKQLRRKSVPAQWQLLL